MPRLIILTILSLYLCCGSTVADDITVSIKGEIHESPCKINGDANFNVGFQTIQLNKVDGKNFAKTKTINMECANYTGTPYIKLTSSQILDSDNILQTTGVNASSLGIALYQGDSVDAGYPLKIGNGTGNGYEIKRGLAGKNNKNSQFTFTAVPYKKSGSTLLPGKFTASVTMTVQYF
ncbi:fimbrial protein [Escherichia coli]|nr:fimbrial protein [Escherichia coli]EGF7412908.1 fimbrial protein [Escherichia coli]EGF7454056.1 fimbrial protein [Escherichia coli]